MRTRYVLAGLGLVVLCTCVSCGKQTTDQRTDILIDDTRTEMARLETIDTWDVAAEEHVKSLMNSEDFRGRARLSPFLHSAFQEGLISKDQATKYVKEAISLHPEDKEYWNRILEVISTKW